MIDVTCAIIRNEENDVLVVQRGEKSDHPFKWEFPGGKTHKGESHEECIIREISEELSMDIVICSTLKPVEHDYGLKQIRLIPFVCDTLDELPILSEHIAFRWVAAGELPEVGLCEADKFVVVDYLAITDAGCNIINSHEESETQDTIDDGQLKEMINCMMSTREADWIASSAVENPAIFKKLLEYSLSNDAKLAFHASWTLSKLSDRNPEFFDPHLSGLVEALAKIDNESVERSFLRILTFAVMEKLSEKHQGLLADHCFRAMNSGKSAIAIKAYSMEIIYKLSIIYPQLANELATSIRILSENGSAGIVARGNMILKKIRDIPIDGLSSQK